MFSKALEVPLPPSPLRCEPADSSSSLLPTAERGRLARGEPQLPEAIAARSASDSVCCFVRLARGRSSRLCRRAFAIRILPAPPLRPVVAAS